MTSLRTKRLRFLLGVAAASLLAGFLWLAYLASRDPGLDWENPNVVEAAEAQRKLRLYEKSLADASLGYVRLSQLEVNSFLLGISTNQPAAIDAPPPLARLTRAGVSLSPTNIAYFAWGEAKLAFLPLRFVLRREFHVEQGGPPFWELPPDSIRIGDLPVPRRFWEALSPVIQGLDAPLAAGLHWATNIPALLVRKNEMSQRPELRLYTYKPIPPADLR